MQLMAKAYRSLSLRTLPSLCRICEQWNSAAICNACRRLHIRQQARCCRCALPSNTVVCAECESHPPLWQRCAAALPYAEPWRSLIADYKFNGHLGLVRFWGECLRQRAAEMGMLKKVELVVPVPLSQARLRERGFNQSLILAKALTHPQVLPEGLLRLRDTQPQANLPRQERLNNLAHAIACNPRHVQDFQQRHVLLVDDVMTTGSTLQACTQALLQVGVQQVHVLVLARADGRQAPQSDPAH